MTETYKKLYQGVLTASPATVYTVPAGTQAIIKSWRAVNLHASADQTVTIWDGGTANSNCIVPALTIPKDGFATEECFICIQAAGTIAAASSAASAITLTIYGLEVSIS